jgi:hypothetical protein
MEQSVLATFKQDSFRTIKQTICVAGKKDALNLTNSGKATASGMQSIILETPGLR